MGKIASSTPVYTIGHSTRTIDEFVSLLRVGQVSLVVDVRTIPRSRTNPQYNLDRLPDELASYQIGHQYIAELGGLRSRTVGIPPEVNGFWQNRSFHNYADYALTPAFSVGLEQLLDLAASERCAVMCAEAVWWRCHRRIIADYLLSRNWSVLHLMDFARAEAARFTKGARVTPDGITYPLPTAGPAKGTSARPQKPRTT
jgi:uncharacterized protein (DUF488 family)